MQFIIFIFFFINCASAEFELPAIETAEQKELLKKQFLKEAPWITSYHGVPDELERGLTKLIPVLEHHEDWKRLSRERSTERSQFFIEEVLPEQKMVRSLKPEIKELWLKESAQLIQKHGSNLMSIVAAEGAWLANHDVKAVIVGLINSLPSTEDRKFFHTLTSTTQQIEKLEASQLLTDEALQSHFRAQAFGFSQNQISKKFLIEFAKESLTRKDNFSSLLRAAWIQNYGDAQPDPFAIEDKKVQIEFFNKISASSDKVDKKLIPFLQRYVNDFSDEYSYEELMTTENNLVGVIEVTEVLPQLGLLRGYLMNDCSTGAYGFACSPQEYIYLIRYDKQPIGFIAATLVKSDNKKVLYLHDFGGQRVTTSIASQVIHAFHLLLPQLGFELLATTSKNGNYGGWAEVETTHHSKEPISLSYEDKDLRNLIRNITGYTHSYDMPEQNTRSFLFQPQSEILKKLKVHFQKIQGPHIIEETQDATDSSTVFMTELKNYHANPQSPTSSEVYNFHYYMMNPHQENLTTHYKYLKTSFARYNIHLSGHFIQEHSYLFWDGHLNARDATTTTDEKLLNQTARFMVHALRHNPNPQTALNTLHIHLDFFKNNKHFQNYLRSFTGRGANELPQIERLLDLGIEMEVLRNPEIRGRILNAAPTSLREKIVKVDKCRSLLTSANSLL